MNPDPSQGELRDFPEPLPSPHATPRNDLAPKQKQRKRLRIPHQVSGLNFRNMRTISQETASPSQPPHQNQPPPLVGGRGVDWAGQAMVPNGLNIAQGMACRTGQGRFQMI